MLRTLIVSATALGLMTGAAVAEPKVMTDEQMDAVVAGANPGDILVQTKSGRTVWTVTDINVPEGYNNGGHDATPNASRGLLNAVAKGGLGTYVVE